jgi:hypothetical protein
MWLRMQGNAVRRSQRQDPIPPMAILVNISGDNQEFQQVFAHHRVSY